MRPARRSPSPTASTSASGASAARRRRRDHGRPQGPGHLVRRTYTEGGGVPCADRRRAGRDRQGQASWRSRTPTRSAARAGVIETTFAEETETDLFGEQVVLCGGLTSLVQAGLRDAGRRRLPARDGVLRVPARGEADRRPHVRGGHRRHALLDLRHRRVRRPDPRPADRHRRDQGRDEEDPRRDPVDGKFAEEWVAESESGRPELQRAAGEGPPAPDRGGRRRPAGDDAVDLGRASTKVADACGMAERLPQARPRRLQ